MIQFFKVVFITNYSSFHKRDNYFIKYTTYLHTHYQIRKWVLYFMLKY